MNKIIKFNTPKIINDYDSISSLILRAVKQEHTNATFYLDDFLRDTYIIDNRQYRIGKKATFNNLYLEQVED